MEPAKQSKLECIIIETSWIFHHHEPIPFSLEKSNRQNIPLRSLQCYSIYHSQNSIEFGINSCFIMKSFYVRNGFSEASTADYPQNVEIEWANWCANVHIRWPLKRNTSKSNEKKHMYTYTRLYPITLVKHVQAAECDCVLVDVQHNDSKHQTWNVEYNIICFIFVVMMVVLCVVMRCTWYSWLIGPLHWQGQTLFPIAWPKLTARKCILNMRPWHRIESGKKLNMDVKCQPKSNIVDAKPMILSRYWFRRQKCKIRYEEDSNQANCEPRK